MNTLRILAINPGSTSTKIALFRGKEVEFSETVEHNSSELSRFSDVNDQLPYRKQTILDALEKHGVKLSDINAFSGRGGGLLPTMGGVYEVTDLMISHTRDNGFPVQHPAKLGPQIAREFADAVGGKAYVVNPPDVDEFQDISRITGFAEIERQSRLHTLNQKEVASRYAEEIGKAYDELNLIVAHIGGGISITPHCKGRMIDSNDITAGDGPMAPTRSGTLPAMPLIKLCFSGKFTQKELENKVIKSGGLIDLLGTSDGREISERISRGDEYAKTVYDTMIYQIAKSIASYTATLKGTVDAIILTGGLVRDKYIVEQLKEYVGWISPIHLVPGEFEMEALAFGALRAINGEIICQVYPSA